MLQSQNTLIPVLPGWFPWVGAKGAIARLAAVGGATPGADPASWRLNRG